MGLHRLRIGPGAVVAAAFIGPGTITTATIAGVDFGTTLVWALVFSTVSTLVLQEMAVRLGVIGGLGLGDAIRERFSGRVARIASAALVLSAILVGNAAYQTGNLLGGGLGIADLLGGARRLWGSALGALAFVILWSGRYVLVERVLVGLVALMGGVFFATAIAVCPSLDSLARGLMPQGLTDTRVLLVALGLVGTTVVPYNLFLHASAARERWRGPDDLTIARADSAISVSLGGLISVAIVVTAAALPAASRVATAADMARALEPLLGSWAGLFFSVGLLSAGFSSAITAPLAAAYATCGIMGWPVDLRASRFRAVWVSVLAAGVFFSALAIQPVPAILFAQAANGLLLPIIAGFLLYLANDRELLGNHANRLASNLAGLAVVFVALLLGLRSIIRAVGSL